MVYRTGGMQPRNAPGEDDDNHSLSDAQRYSPADNAWHDLPPLPTPRSSHDMVVVDNRLYVIGGWNMTGSDTDPAWLTTVDYLDLTQTPMQWQRIAQPFTRRALIAAALEDKIFVIGGMDQTDTVTTEVDILDLRTHTWSKGPSIPGKSFNGFSPAAAVVDGALYLSVGSGDLYRLSDDASQWLPHARTTPRIVHRMIPRGSDLLLIGGAAGQRMLDLVEAVSTR